MDHRTPYFDLVMTRLRACKHSELSAIAAASGVPAGTIRKLFYGEVTDPRIKTVEALHEYFERRQPAPALPKEASHA